MARTIAQIQAQILAEKANQPALSGLNSPSRTSIYNLWSFITAVAINLQEQLWDVFKTNLETDISQAPVGTDGWVQAQCFKFQYDATTPQIITLNDFVPSYNPVDITKQLITRSSVLTLPSRIVSVKVAKSEPPQALAAPELAAFQGYLSEIAFSGVQINAVSYPPDQMMIAATINYNGLYAGSIQSSVIASINNYMKNLPFDGNIVLSQLEIAILATPGVTDLVFNNVALRSYSVPLALATYLVQANTELLRSSGTFSGYVIPETTGGYDLASTLIFVTP
jgi:hypothetical protein